MRPRFLVMLTLVRQDDQARDERHRPETTIEAIGTVNREAAQRMFTGLCALPAVKAGRQRAKIVELAGKDRWQAPSWVAPLITDATRRALIKLGARRCQPWTHSTKLGEAI